MEILLPRSMVFADDEHYDLNWNKALWGTERDVKDYSIIVSGDTLKLVYNTVWTSNKGWVEALCCYLHHYLSYSPKKHTCNLEVEHKYSDYPGNFGGSLSWKPEMQFVYKHYDSYMEYLRNTNTKAYQHMLEVEKNMKSEDGTVGLISIPI